VSVRNGSEAVGFDSSESRERALKLTNKRWSIILSNELFKIVNLFALKPYHGATTPLANTLSPKASMFFPLHQNVHSA